MYLGDAKAVLGTQLRDEGFATLIQTCCGFVGIFRIVWPWMLERTTFKATFGLLLLLQIINAYAVPPIIKMGGLGDPDDQNAVVPHVHLKRAVYCASLLGSYLTMGGVNVLYLIILVKL